MKTKSPVQTTSKIQSPNQYRSIQSKSWRIFKQKSLPVNAAKQSQLKKDSIIKRIANRIRGLDSNSKDSDARAEVYPDQTISPRSDASPKSKKSTPKTRSNLVEYPMTSALTSKGKERINSSGQSFPVPIGEAPRNKTDHGKGKGSKKRLSMKDRIAMLRMKRLSKTECAFAPKPPESESFKAAKLRFKMFNQVKSGERNKVSNTPCAKLGQSDSDKVQSCQGLRSQSKKYAVKDTNRGRSPNKAVEQIQILSGPVTGHKTISQVPAFEEFDKIGEPQPQDSWIKVDKFRLRDKSSETGEESLSESPFGQQCPGQLLKVDQTSRFSKVLQQPKRRRSERNRHSNHPELDLTSPQLGQWLEPVRKDEQLESIEEKLKCQKIPRLTWQASDKVVDPLKQLKASAEIQRATRSEF